MFEHRNEPILPRPHFVRRLARSIALGFCMVGVGLAIGTIGYHATEGLPWIDAFYNASMILTGMGPAGQLETSSGKLFAASYAILSGVAFPTTIGIIMAPVVHRFLHKLHAEERQQRQEPHPPAQK
jgi:hypothetical protein